MQLQNDKLSISIHSSSGSQKPCPIVSHSTNQAIHNQSIVTRLFNDHYVNKLEAPKSL